MNALQFQKKLLSMQENMMNFALMLTANRDDAQDLMQDTTLKVLDNQEKFVDNINFKGWVLTVMRNIFINNYHKVVRVQTVVDSSADLYNLDVANEQRILRQARRLARTRGMTVLCTLHDLNQAMAYGDRLFLMRDGQVRYAGNGDILTPETVWDIFGARVRAAEIDGQKILIGVNEDED